MTPESIGPYRIIRQLGEGGMGVVFEAVHDTIERRVAIKVLHAEFAHNHDVTTRFFNEARAVNRIEHPGLVQISDYARLPDGSAYIVMEYLRGESLASRIQRSGGKLSIGSALQIAWQLADVLTYAHAKEIVHRDLKPENAMLIKDAVAPGGERVKLLDFGIAKLADAAASGQIKTRTNMIMGTPRYMSPEQCRGAREVDGKTDVYSLGVILFEMLGGRPPFDGPGTGEVLAMHIYEPPPALQMVAPEIPDDVASLVHSMLAKEREQRPTMRQAAESLGALSQRHATANEAQSSPLTGPRRNRSSGTLALSQHEASQFPSTLADASAQAISHSKRSGFRINLAVLAVVISITVMTIALSGSIMNSSKPDFHISNFITKTNQRIAASPNITTSHRTVTWSISTNPPGASVVQIRDNTVLGITPWSGEAKNGVGFEDLELRLAGYKYRQISLQKGMPESLTESLDPLTAPSSEVQIYPNAETSKRNSNTEKDKNKKKLKPARGGFSRESSRSNATVEAEP